MLLTVARPLGGDEKITEAFLHMAHVTSDLEGREGGSRVPRRRANQSFLPGTKSIARSSNKLLSSRFRGVCWNKKNHRWQTAINVGAK
jgi:hypothetical protein